MTWVIVIAVVVFFIVVFAVSESKPKKPLPQEQLSEEEQPSTVKLPVDRQLYNAVKRKEKELKEEKTEVKHQQRLNQYTALENNIKNESDKVELKKAIVEFDQEKLEHNKEKALFEIERQGYYLRMQSDLQKLALQKFKLSLVEWFHNQFHTLDMQKIKLAMEENRLLKEKAIAEIAKRENELRHEMQRLTLKDWESNLIAEESKLTVGKNQLQLKYDNFAYLEHRIFKHYGYESFDDYFDRWQSWDRLARDNYFSSVDSFLGNMLDNRGYRFLKEQEQKYYQTIQKLQAVYLENPEVKALLERNEGE